MIPLPSVLTRLISPQTFSVYKQYTISLSKFSFYPLSIYSFSTREEIIKFISFLVIFIVAINTFDDRQQFKRIILTIIFLSLALTFYGLIKKYFVLNKTASAAFGTFGNRNHYAAYMVMTAPLAVGYALSCENKFQRFIFAFFAAIITTGVFLSLSRAGSLALIFAFILMFFLFMIEKTSTKNYWVIAAPIFLGVFLLFIAGFEPLRNRLISSWDNLGVRWEVFADAFGVIKDFPFFGVGFGNFERIFTIYLKSTHSVYYKYLHNDFLQLIIEMGLIGATLYFVFLFNVFKDILSTLKQRHNLFTKNIVIGGLSGLCGVMAHSFVEYNFHVPAISLLFWFILGLIYKCSYTHFYHTGDKS